MKAAEILKDIIGEFSTDEFVHFFREKNRAFAPRREELFQYDDDLFKNGVKLGEIQFSRDEKMLICCFESDRPLSERSGKKAQYEKAKRILRESQSDAGIFIFYDPQGNFRFSLIYANYSDRRRDWNTFRRFTYFVSKEQTNKTFLQQIGEGDFSTLEKIKEAFSVDPVTKQFYNEIQAWYFWAMDKIKFPEDYKYSADPAKDKEIRNATNLIRLITRIIFIWFLKERGLIPPELFTRERIKEIVKDFNSTGAGSSNYYNAVLQNLFFGTLNQKMKERKFADEKGYLSHKKEYGIKNLFRYADKFLINKDEVLELLKNIPFLNGGLFDCLDKEDETGKVLYIDGFSRNPAKQSIIPDYLFFLREDESVSLSQYGLGSSKRPVRGLIEILNSYNFTIDENTPIDQEIALDPELLGKVFENLLASYNPETATTARKSTGSYYTPREIVDYMVEASLLEYLKGKLPQTNEKEIKMLFSYSEEVPAFSNEETQTIISTIDHLKILDPACGSGAFPMGVLHKLVHTLQKLDSENKYWYELQYQKALKESEEIFKEKDRNRREERLKEINETFDQDMNYPDYARKLYLIENCIYGVDIQPIAIQISKLRFFISLVLDQKVDKSKENLGIRALPNLETKFVAANTLIGLDKPQHLFYTDKIRKLEDEIKSLRHKYFQAKARSEKLDYQKKDKELRRLLSKELKSIGFSSDSSEKIAKFDLYDQNASADWFDSEWMFGLKDGFDVVIANPPYVSVKGISNAEKKIFSQIYTAGQGRFNLFTLFLEKGHRILKNKGILTYILPEGLYSNVEYRHIRKYILENTTILFVNMFSDRVFEAAVDTSIISFMNKPHDNEKCSVFRDLNQSVFQFNQDILIDLPFHLFIVSLTPKSAPLIYKLLDKKFNRIENILEIQQGIIYSGQSKDKVFSDDKKDENYKKVLDGRDVLKWKTNWGEKKENKYIYYSDKLHRPREERLFLAQEKILLPRKSIKISCAYDNEQYYALNTAYLCLLKDKNYKLKFILACLNSKLINYYYSILFFGWQVTIPALNLIPIKKISIAEQQPFITLVNQILSLKKSDPQADTIALEAEIDRLVYKLYDLTKDEIEIVKHKI